MSVAARLGVHKEQVTACVQLSNRAGERSRLRAGFGTMTGDLLGLRDWLAGLGVSHVAMEATGVYWKPVSYLLEDDFELLLVKRPARQEHAWPKDRCAGRAPKPLQRIHARLGFSEA
jgi:hypothetical protein